MADARRAPVSGVVSSDVLEIWRAKLGKAMGQPYLVALMLGSMLLSAASFFTTFDGMLNFMPVWAVTFCIVFAIQALLFVASWRLGFALADRESPPLFSAFVFLICLATSVFFSWVSLFGAINDAETQKRTSATRMHRAVEETIVETQTRVETERRRLGEALLADQGYGGWTAHIDRVAQAALGARAALDAARDAEAARISARIQEIEGEKAALLKGAAGSKARSAAAEREVKRIEDARAGLIERIKTLRAEADAANIAVVRKQGEMDAEEHGGASGGGTGRGSVWRGLRDAKAVLEADLGAKRKLLEAAEARLAASDERAEALRIQIAEAQAGDGSAELGLVEARLAQMKERIDAIQAGESSDVAAEIAAMRSDLTRFETGFDVALFDRAAARCEALLDTMKSVRATGEAASKLTCDRELVAGPLSLLRQTSEAATALAASCAPGGANARAVTDLAFKEGVAYGRQCVALSGLPAASLADLRGRIDRLVLEEDVKASAFVKTVNAWSDGDKMAYFALAIALFIDLLVLLSGLIGAVSVTSEMGRAFGRGFAKRDIENAKRALSLKAGDPFAIARAILEIVEPSDEKRYIGEVTIEHAPPDLRGGVRQFLLLQCEKKLAERKKPRALFAAEGDKALTFLVRERVLSALRAYLEETEVEQEEAAQRRAIAASGLRVGDDLSFLLEQLGAPERRAATLDVAFRAMKPPSAEPRNWLDPGDWLRAPAAAEIYLKDVRSALRAASEAAAHTAQDGGAEEPVDADEAQRSAKPPTNHAEVKRLCFALYRRGLAWPLPQDEKTGEAPGYRLSERAIALLERAAKYGLPSTLEEAEEFDPSEPEESLAAIEAPAAALLPPAPAAAHEPDNMLHAELRASLQRYAHDFVAAIDAKQQTARRRAAS